MWQVNVTKGKISRGNLTNMNVGYSARLGKCVGLVRASQHMYGLARGLDLYVWSEGQDRQLPCVRACYHASSSCRAICPLTHTHAHHLAAIPPSVGWIWGALPVRIERTQSMRCKCSLGLKSFLDPPPSLWALWARGYFRWLLWSSLLQHEPGRLSQQLTNL